MNTSRKAIASLLTGATVWGLIWYPYRALYSAGVSAVTAATLTYAGAFVLAIALLRRGRWAGQAVWPLLLIGFTAGWCNIGFALAVVHGDVMRVVLLFYLAPVWTVLFARLLLDERLNRRGYLLMMMAVMGAAIMLWNPAMALPLPRSAAEWGALAAGAMFALSNVLARKHSNYSIETKTVTVLAGCTAAGVLCMLFQPAPPPVVWNIESLIVAALLALVLFSANVASQYGLAHAAANRAIVIYLFELVVTAVSSWLLAGETLGWSEWCGGALIIGSAVLSGHLSNEEPAKAGASAGRTAGAHSDRVL